MRLKIRRVELRAITTGPECGASLDFTDGLNILRADNSSGKSTCVQAIIYGLGLEGMLSARRDVPLPHAMTHAVDIGGTELPVLDSHVSIEIENGEGDILTVTRAVKSATIDRTLVQTWRGPALTSPGEWPRQDYFVRRAGAATRESGFQFQLAKFIGWTVPQVTRMDGGEAPLYLEALFPYFYVEQKHGWSGVHARIPGYLGLRDPGKRAVEFILGLETYDRILARQRLMAVRSVIDADWRSTVQAVSLASQAAGVLIRGLPERPTADFDALNVETLVSTGNGWQSIGAAVKGVEDLIRRLEQANLRQDDEARGPDEDALADQHRLLTDVAAQFTAVVEELADVRRRREGIDSRLEALEEDLQRHRDLSLLENLGSSEADLEDELTVCPTCHQDLHDGIEISHHVMSVVENVQFIEQQLQTFRSMRQDTDRVLLALDARERALRGQATEIRRSIRVRKEALVGVGSGPSVVQVTERLRAQDRHEELVRIQRELRKHLMRLSELSSTWRRNEERLAAYRGGQLSDSDEVKLATLERVLRAQLMAYGFQSLSPEAVEISKETYRPIHEGFDLGFDLSASDMIRLIWSYLLGLVQTSAELDGRHPRLLIFDEPRQQDTARLSFRRLLERSATLESVGSDGQIIFATSEDQVELEEMLGGLPRNLISFAPQTKIIGPLT